MAKHTIEQRHSITMTIGTPVVIPWVSKKGVSFDLADEGEKVATVRVTGALIHVRRADKKKWVKFSIKKFLDMLEV